MRACSAPTRGGGAGAEENRGSRHEWGVGRGKGGKAHLLRVWLPVQHGGLVAAHLVRVDGHLVVRLFLLQATPGIQVGGGVRGVRRRRDTGGGRVGASSGRAAGERIMVDRARRNHWGGGGDHRRGVACGVCAGWGTGLGRSGRASLVTWTTWSACASPGSSKSDDSGSVSEVTTCRTVSGRICPKDRRGTGPRVSQGDTPSPGAPAWPRPDPPTLSTAERTLR